VRSYRAHAAARPRPPEAAHEKETRHGAISECSGGSKEGSGDRYSVHGVDNSDTLNMREKPDAKSTVIGELAPDATGIVDLGEERQVGPSSWRKVKCGKLRGWANARFLARDSGK